MLGILCDLTDEKAKAEQLYRSSLRIYEVQVGADHELTIDISNALQGIMGAETEIMQQTSPQDQVEAMDANYHRTKLEMDAEDGMDKEDIDTDVAAIAAN